MIAKRPLDNELSVVVFVYDLYLRIRVGVGVRRARSVHRHVLPVTRARNLPYGVMKLNATPLSAHLPISAGEQPKYPKQQMLSILANGGDRERENPDGGQVRKVQRLLVL